MGGAKLHKFLADAADDDLEGFDPLVDGRLPHLIVNLFIGKHLSGMPCEKIQYVKFKGGKVGGFLSKTYAAVSRVYQKGAIL